MGIQFKNSCDERRHVHILQCRCHKQMKQLRTWCNTRYNDHVAVTVTISTHLPPLRLETTIAQVSTLVLFLHEVAILDIVNLYTE